jgi:ATP-dependent RNA helicase RhlE
VRDRHPRALVLTPTRELALQVQKAVATYGRHLSLRSVTVYGGASMTTQLSALRKGVDIVVATPGRLLDHLQQRSVDLSHIQVLVLDEADRMLDMGFIHDVKRIIARLPAERQTMLFSATLSGDIQSLASGVLRNPHVVEAGERRNPVETITQHFYAASREAKMDLLMHAIDAEKMESVLVFSRTKHGADKICRRLDRRGILSVAIHSNRTQSQRERALDGFKAGKFQVLVATDIAARGIDVSGISHVVNYDVPQFAEDYIHRIGRTGRAGASGDAITFVSRDEGEYLTKIEKYTGKRFPVKPYPNFVAPAPSSAAAAHVSAHAPHGEGSHRPKEHSQARHPGRGRSTSPGKRRFSGGKKRGSSRNSLAWSNH